MLAGEFTFTARKWNINVLTQIILNLQSFNLGHTRPSGREKRTTKQRNNNLCCCCRAPLRTAGDMVSIQVLQDVRVAALDG